MSPSSDAFFTVSRARGFIPSRSPAPPDTCPSVTSSPAGHPLLRNGRYEAPKGPSRSNRRCDVRGRAAGCSPSGGGRRTRTGKPYRHGRGYRTPRAGTSSNLPSETVVAVADDIHASGRRRPDRAIRRLVQVSRLGDSTASRAVRCRRVGRSAPGWVFRRRPPAHRTSSRRRPGRRKAPVPRAGRSN